LVEQGEAGGQEAHPTHEEDDSGCECSLAELEGMDAWTKTLVAIRVLTAFKKRRKKRLEQEQEQKEKAKKERRKTLWRRLGFKLRIFNMFANKISSDDPIKERLTKLKRKLGDVTIECEDDAYRYQVKIEESLQYQLGFQLKPGDIILTHFDSIPGQSCTKKGRRRSKVFERTLSFDDSNPRAARKGRKPLNNVPKDSLHQSLLDQECGRRRSWHNEDIPAYFLDFGVLPGKSRIVHVAPIVIVTTPVLEVKPPPIMPTSIDPPYQHYIHEVKKERRPSIVRRNFRKIFGK